MGRHYLHSFHSIRSIYIECIGPGGILEWDTIMNTLVKQHSTMSGSLRLSRDESFVLVTQKSHSRAYMLKPGTNGVPSTVLFEFDVPGKPGDPAFFPKGGVASKNYQVRRV